MSRVEIASSHSGERLKDIPEIYEADAGTAQCLQSRTEALEIWVHPTLFTLSRALLVHPMLREAQAVMERLQVSSYHFVLGADASSSASIAAYVNSLNYSLETSTGWFRTNPWKIVRSVYCSYDAFTGLDIRVEARMPGGVTAYAVSSSGNKAATNSEMWQSLFVCAVLRSIHYASLALPGLRRVDPLSTEPLERRFLEAAKKIFWNGWSLGALEGQPIASNVDNYLATGILKFYAESQRPETASVLFRELSNKDPEVNSLLASCLLRSDREPEAVRILHHSLATISPNLASLLALQVDFLCKKNQYAEAVQVAEALVKAAPIDYTSWIILARAQIKVGNYEAALLALNTCPISAQPLCDLDQQKSLPLGLHDKLWLPRHPDAPINLSLDSPPSPDGVLEKLKGASLRGATAKAYKVLVELVNAVSWDGLLQIRSNIFLMEEEYRAARHTLSSTSPLSFKDANGVPVPEGSANETHSTSPVLSDLQDVPLDDVPPQSQGATSTFAAQLKPLVKSQRSVKEKRLCERWLDNLFMILFEDMRVYTIYRGELAHFSTTNTPYIRNPREWHILGNLCRRLAHMEDAKEAYRSCVEAGFSWDAWLALLEMYVEEGRIGHAITAAVKLLQYEAGHFVTSMVGKCILRLIRTQGVERIKIALISLNLSSPLDASIQKYLDYASCQKCMGHDY